MAPVCEAAAQPQPEMILDADKQLGPSTKNRFLSFAAGDVGREQVILVTLKELPAPYDEFNDRTMWVGEPREVSEIAARTDTSPPTFWTAPLQCATPVVRDWTTYGTVHVYSPFIVPDGTYEIRVLDSGCTQSEFWDPAIVPPLVLETSVFGDVCAALPKNNYGDWGPPDDSPDITADVLAVKQKFGNQPGLTKARAELGAEMGDPEPDLTIDISRDVLWAKEAFHRRPYDMFFPPPPWPCP